MRPHSLPVPLHLPHPATSGLPKALERLIHFRPAQAWIFALLCADLAVLADLSARQEVWFGPVYLFVVCLGAWSLGWWGAHAIGIGCMFLSLAINGIGLYPNGAADFGWNLTVRIATVSVVITLIVALRRGYFREWWLARTDALSGALNRQAFFELGSGLADDRRWRLLMYADLDGLKQINDTHGHACGDAMLKSFANAVKRAIRRDDLFARVGGDEFLIFMPVRDLVAARAVATRLHKAMNNVAGDESISPRCSAGALVIPPGAMPLDDLVRRADALMYCAKTRGACLEIEVESSMSKFTGPGRARAVSRVSFLKAPPLMHRERRKAEARQPPQALP